MCTPLAQPFSRPLAPRFSSLQRALARVVVVGLGLGLLQVIRTQWVLHTGLFEGLRELPPHLGVRWLPRARVPCARGWLS
jgi:hypothetical protein